MDSTKPKIEIIKKIVDESHFYFVNGEYFPGVTSILDEAAPMAYGLREFLKYNTAEQAEEIKTTAMNFGSKMHEAYEKLLKGETLNLLTDYPYQKEKKHLVSFYQWFADNKPTNLEIEFTIASLTYKYAGTLDLVCTINDELWLIDFKTSKALYKTNEYQVAAYKHAYEEMTGKKIDHVALLRTGSQHKAGYEFKEVFTPIEEFVNIYKTYLSLHDGVIPQPPLVNSYPETLKLNSEEVTK